MTDAGIGIGLFEETTYDPQDGALINNNLVDYMVTIPSSWEHLVNQKLGRRLPLISRKRNLQSKSFKIFVCAAQVIGENNKPLRRLSQSGIVIGIA